MQEQAHVTLEMVAGEVSVDLATAELAVSSVTAAPLSLDRQSDGLEGPFTLQDKLARVRETRSIRPRTSLFSGHCFRVSTRANEGSFGCGMVKIGLATISAKSFVCPQLG
jgi:hypothetical protein